MPNTTQTETKYLGKDPSGNQLFTIVEAADEWIAQLQASTASQEMKDALIAQIQQAAPKASFPTSYHHTEGRGSFISATNAIKTVIRGGR